VPWPKDVIRAKGFGLIRHSYGFKQFCRKKCLQKYKKGSKPELSLRRGWFYLLPRGSGWWAAEGMGGR
jgi:hypothetical protein